MIVPTIFPVPTIVGATVERVRTLVVAKFVESIIQRNCLR